MRWMRIAAVALALSACGAETAAPTTAPAPTSAPTAAPATDAPPQFPAVGPVDQLAAAALAKQLSLQPADVTVSKVEAQDWPDSSLGCPDADMMYMTVITPGSKVTLEAGGKSYEVHTNADGSQLVLCEGGKPTPLGEQGGGTGGQSSQLPPAATPPATAPPTMTSPPPTKAPPPAKPAAQATATRQPAAKPLPTATPLPPTEVPPMNQNTPDLVAERVVAHHSQAAGVDAGSVKVLSVQAQEWPSSGLGCEQPDMMYLAVITPGYAVVLEEGGANHIYHTNADASQIVSC